MKINHRKIDNIAVAMFLFCMSSIAFLLTFWGIRSMASLKIDDVYITGAALLGGLLIVSRRRIDSLSIFVHKLFKLSY